MKRSFRDTFFIYEGIRKAFLFGLNVKPILKALNTGPGERILDVGCGFGLFSKHFTDCDYTGIDIDPERIGWAVSNIGETAKRRFITGDVRYADFPKDSFDKAVCYGLLHHLSDKDAKLCLAGLSRIVKGDIVFSDPVYSGCHLISNILCALDRGKFIRYADGYRDICRDGYTIRIEQFFYSNNYIAKYHLMAVSKKREEDAHNR